MAGPSDPALVNAIKGITKAIDDQNRTLKDVNQNLVRITRLLGYDPNADNIAAYLAAGRVVISDPAPSGA